MIRNLHKQAVVLIIALLLSAVMWVAAGDQAGAAPEAPDTAAVPTHHQSAWNVCAWVGVRDGVLGGAYEPYTELKFYYHFYFYGSSNWVKCSVEIRIPVGSLYNVSCHHYIVNDHTGQTIHLEPTTGPCRN